VSSGVKNFPNILWYSGNDFQNRANTNDDAAALGIQDIDTNALGWFQLSYRVKVGV